MTSRTPIRFNAFSMNAASHQSPGLWRHPLNRSQHHNRLPYWLELAHLLERGCSMRCSSPMYWVSTMSIRAARMQRCAGACRYRSTIRC